MGYPITGSQNLGPTQPNKNQPCNKIPFFAGKVHGIGQRVDAEIRNVIKRLEKRKKHIRN